MFRWRMLVAAMAAGVAVVATPVHAQVLRQAQAPAVAAPQTSAAVVAANRSWTSTGAMVRAGGRLQITAQGRWTLSAATVAAVVATGPDGQAGRTNPNALLANANVGALVGRIGANGKPFLVGSTYDAAAGADGELFLAINDAARDLADNTGRVSVSISVRPPAPNLRPAIIATPPRVTAPVQTTRPQITTPAIVGQTPTTPPSTPPSTRAPPTQSIPAQTTPTQTTPTPTTPPRTTPPQSTTPPRQVPPRTAEPPQTRPPVTPPTQTAPPTRTPPTQTTPPQTTPPPQRTPPPATQPPQRTPPPATAPPQTAPVDPTTGAKPPAPVVETPPELIETAPLPTDAEPIPPPVAAPEVAPEPPVQPTGPTNWLVPALAVAAGLLVLIVLFGFRPGARKSGGDAEKSAANAPRITTRVTADGRAGESLSVNWRGRS